MLKMEEDRWCFLLVFLVVWSSSTFIVMYVVAVFRHDVDVLFLYISDTGANPPESCIFGMMTFDSACAGMSTIYSRFKFVEKLCEETRAVNPRLNKTALALGMLSCLGNCVVATFQETTMTTVHDIGALLFFLTGVLYILLQSTISNHDFPYGSSLAVCRARLAVAVLASLAIFPSILVCGCQVILHFSDEITLNCHLCIFCQAKGPAQRRFLAQLFTLRVKTEML
uniref:DNA-damage regulated autophagy modulator 1 n=1 Tax=Hippocampus comes TaxID=109280 RepID=A0A3Q3DZF9_HIPCM